MSVDKWVLDLREPFQDTDVSWLPKPTKAQTEAVKKDFRAGWRCNVCGAWHHPEVAHLPYVGHAAVTHRLLNVDPLWNWDFLCTKEDGSPVIDENGGLWITLTIKGVTRKGYGDAPNSKGADAMKERIGDAIRNAAMRFGVALELWHKGALSEAVSALEENHEAPKEEKPAISDEGFAKALENISCGDLTSERLQKSRNLTEDQLAKLLDFMEARQ